MSETDDPVIPGEPTPPGGEVAPEAPPERPPKSRGKFFATVLATATAIAVGVSQYSPPENDFTQCVDTVLGESAPRESLNRLVRTVSAQNRMDAQDAYDVVMETLMAVCQRDDVVDVRAYFRAALGNRAKSYHRARRSCSLDTIADGCLVHPGLGPASAVQCRELETRVHKAFCSLSNYDQQLLQTRFFLERDYDALARQYNTSSKTMRRHVDTAIQNLRNRFNTL